MKIGVLHGPNLNYLGKRDKNIYGSFDQDAIQETLKEEFNEDEFEFFQSNSEGNIIDKLYQWNDSLDGIICNAGAYSHYSIAIRDAIEAISIPVIEVHISNIYARESFRQHSVISAVCRGTITGLGIHSYILACRALHLLKE